MLPCSVDVYEYGISFARDFLCVVIIFANYGGFCVLFLIGYKDTCYYIRDWSLITGREATKWEGARGGKIKGVRKKFKPC